MKNFIVYNTEGEILRTGICPANALALQAGPGETVIEGVADDATEEVVDDVVQLKTVDLVEVKAAVQDELRVIRNGMLTGTDWTQLSDNSLTALQKTEWGTYRQALRDLPANNPDVTSLSNVVFPTPPS